MKTLCAIVAALLFCSVSAFADDWTISQPSVLVDGQGYAIPQVWNAADTEWVKQTGTAAGAMSVSAVITSIAETVNTNVTGGSLQSVAAVNAVNTVAHDTIDHIAPMTTTALAADTELTGTQSDTFTLSGGPYQWIYVSSDTDIIVALTAAESLAGTGDVVYAGMTIPYNFSTSTVYIRTLTGLAATGKHIAVRGMR